MPPEDVIYRPPKVEEGAYIWQLVHDSGGLDRNSPYCYLLLCKHFFDTCAVAEANGEIVGFVTAYRLPRHEDTLFIWQIGVATALRDQGIATRLLQEVLQRDTCHGVRFLEATVGPSNQASHALFTALAQRLSTGLCEQPCFDAALFPHANHAPENLLRIGPFSPPLANET